MTLGDRIALLRDGSIEQVGPPLDLYRRPASRFVATFLGSPPINIWPATFGPAGVLNVAGGSLPFARRPGDAPQAPASMEVGVRPEDISVFEHAAPGRIPGTVVLTEPMGNETIVTLESAGQRVVARAAADFAARPATPVFFSIAEGQALYFDAGTGRRFD
jgi:multiple sugar transport system ATP-binding protein